MITYKSQEEIEIMKKSGEIAATILSEIQDRVEPGVSTHELNVYAEDRIEEFGVEPAFKGYEGFPAALCTSVNDIVVHGVPQHDPLKEGDVLGLDFGVIYNGWYSDLAVTVGVGNISPEARRIMRVTKKALRLAIKKAKPGNTTGDIGNTVQRFVEEEGFNVVKELVGHGVGRELHEDPVVPNHGKRGEGVELKEGMVIAIEPMVVAGDPELQLHYDKFGYASKHKYLTAHFEHTMAITERGAEILTIPENSN